MCGTCFWKNVYKHTTASVLPQFRPNQNALSWIWPKCCTVSQFFFLFGGAWEMVCEKSRNYIYIQFSMRSAFSYYFHLLCCLLFVKSFSSRIQLLLLLVCEQIATALLHKIKVKIRIAYLLNNLLIYIIS